MYIQVKDNMGAERFIEEEYLETAITSGEIMAFRRSDGWVVIPVETVRRSSSVSENGYGGQERRRSKLGRPRKSASNDPVK